MSVEIPKYQPIDYKRQQATDAVSRSISKPDAFAKPGTLGSSKGVRVRLTSGDKSLLPRRKKKHHDKRDVHFY